MTIFDKLFKSVDETAKHKNKMRELIDDMSEEYTEKAGIGTGYSSGMSIGQGMDRPGASTQAAASAAPRAVNAITSGSSRGPAAKPAQAPSAPGSSAAAPSAPAASPTASSAGSSGARTIGAGSPGPSIGIGHGPIQRGLDTPCKCGVKNCGCEVSKAVKASALSVPRHLRQGAVYDPNDIQRSATAQTSKMYTALAQPVQDTLDNIVDRDAQQLRLNAVKSQEEASRKVQEMREKLNAAMVPKTSTRFGKNSR